MMKKIFLSSLILFPFTLQITAQEPDMLEPNDKPEQAVNIDLFTPYMVSIYPAGDYDFFSFSIAKPLMIQPISQDAPGSVYWELLDEKGNTVAVNFPALAPAGKYYLKMSGSTSPDQFMIMVKCFQATNMQKIPATVEINKPYYVSLSSNNETDSFSIKTTGSGYVTLQSFQAAGSSVQFACTLNGNEYRGNPLVIPVNNQPNINARMMAGNNYSNAAFILYASEGALMDETEPNDSIPVAKNIDKSSRVFFSLYPSGDQDWFAVKTIAPGKIFVDLSYAFTGGSNGSNFPYAAELYDEKKNMVCTFGYRPTGNGYIYSSTFLKTEGTYYIKVFSGSQFEAEQLLSMRLYGNVSGDAATDPFKDIYFVGFELDTSANATLQALSESEGANFTMVDSTGDIGKTLSKVFEDARKERRSSRWLWWMIGGIAAAGAGYWVYKKRSKSQY